MISRFLARLIAWFYGQPRAFDAPVGPRFDSASVTLPEGPYREPAGLAISYPRPTRPAPVFDAKAARRLATAVESCPDDIFEKALKDIEAEARKGKTTEVVTARQPAYKKDLKRRLEALGFRCVNSSSKEWLIVQWGDE